LLVDVVLAQGNKMAGSNISLVDDRSVQRIDFVDIAWGLAINNEVLRVNLKGDSDCDILFLAFFKSFHSNDQNRAGSINLCNFDSRRVLLTKRAMQRLKSIKLFFLSFQQLVEKVD
jgi:hypothetical protein